MVRVIAISNQKGGVGKTTTAVNLATALAACRKKVLLIDFDPQGNSTTAFGVDKTAIDGNAYMLVMGQADLKSSTVATEIPGLDLVPCTLDLAGAEVELVPQIARETCLKKALKADDYDFVFIDCPPSLGLLTINALTAADEVLVPLQCEFYAMEGLSQLFRTIDLVKRNLNPALKLLGVLLTMYDKRNRLADQVVADVRDNLGPRVLETIIPRNVRLSEAPSHGQPGILYDHKCSGSQAYINLAAEILNKPQSTMGAAA